jgi:hypothetical protein
MNQVKPDLVKSIRDWWIVFTIGLLLFMTEQIPLFLEFIVYFFSLATIGYRFFKTPLKIAYLARLLLFIMVGAYAYGVKLLFPDTYFSVFEFSTQRLEIARQMFALTLIGLPFCFIGLSYGERIPIKFKATPPEYESTFYQHLSFLFGLAITLAVVVLTQTISKGNIFQGAYGGAIEGTSLPLGGINTLAGIGVVIMLYWSAKTNRKIYWAVFALATTYYLVSCLLLRGLRQDIASLLFCLVVCFFTLKFKDFKFKWRYVGYLLPLLVAFEFFGLVRSGLSQWISGKIPFTEVLSIGLGNANYSDVIYSGTLGPISTTLANAIDGIFYNSVPITWGKGYLDYIPRLAPEILSPNRPEDYAWFFRGIYSTGGGIFEIAEAIINFSWVGAIILPFLVSMAYSFIYRNFESRKTLYWTILMGAVLCVFLRGAWYQTFAYVKAVEIGIFVCLLQHFTFAFFKYFMLPLIKK